MGTIAPCSSPFLQDLKVSVHKSTIITPSEPTGKKSLFLSNIDQVLNLDVETIHFFPSNSEFPPDIVAEKLEAALGKLLVTYDFMAGRLKINPEAGRLEIDCNEAGVRFTVAASELTLEGIGDLVYPNPAFGQLIVKEPEAMGLEDRPLLSLQVTSFKCGAFAIGMSSSHTTLDGLSVKMFLDNLAALAADKPLAVVPFHNRRLLAARSPPLVAFPHRELLPLDELTTAAQFLGQAAAAPSLEFKLFQLTADDISQLKEKAKLGGGPGHSVTSFNVVTAHIWRCKVLATQTDQPDKPTTVLYAVDIRRRLRPQLPSSYTGNAVLTGYGEATRRELAEGPFSRLVEAVWEGANRMTNEYARSVIDWGEFHKGVPHGDVALSSWWKLGMSEVHFPWGRAIYTCPVMMPTADIVVLLPGMVGVNTNGVNALVGLPKKDMEQFDCLFHQFLA